MIQRHSPIKMIGTKRHSNFRISSNISYPFHPWLMQNILKYFIHDKCTLVVTFIVRGITGLKVKRQRCPLPPIFTSFLGAVRSAELRGGPPTPAQQSAGRAVARCAVSISQPSATTPSQPTNSWK